MKRKHPDAVLLFRVGDFYETFSEDAITASEVLGITLTKRANGAAQHVELAGFPHHALDTYLPKLVRAGKRVAICEQLEDPKLAKTLVRRGITELVTPGVTMSESVLENKENNFLAALHFAKDDKVGVSFLDISTGEFLAAQGTADYAEKLLQSFAPKEVLVERGKKQLVEAMNDRFLCFELDDWVYTPQSAQDRLLKQFGTSSLKGFGLDGQEQAVIAAGSVLHYLDITCHTQTSHITSLRCIEGDRYVRLDRWTVRNLEIFSSMAPEGKTLLSVLDRTVSPMGGRLLRRDLAFPLKEVAEINKRLEAVSWFHDTPEMTDHAREMLSLVGDVERIVSKIASNHGSPREVLGLKRALETIPSLVALCGMGRDKSTLLKEINEQLNPCRSLVDEIKKAVYDQAPAAVGKGNVIKPGVNAELDELRNLANGARDFLAQLNQREAARTGISSLKVGFNNVFGYYLEVTNTHKDKVPPEWIRKQTLTSAERYITPELKEYEEKILGAQDKIEALERAEFDKLIEHIKGFIPVILLNSQLMARMDVTSALALVALDNRYCRPEIDESLDIDITEGRHPVIERELPPGEPYISNSVSLSNEQTQVMMITGPNMSGKSALLRQTALIVLMAQIGSFVPAQKARIGIVDKIFTRVGASDNLSVGESTFMVEMNEASSILNNMSARSLILFDELGRGTSTYDGISIAWAIVEYIHQHGSMHPKTLFATHYHELNEMAESFPRVKNFNVQVKDIDGKVVFLRKLAPGGSDRSFGIHVARLAGMPRAVVERADEILLKLEKRDQPEITDAKPKAQSQEPGYQLSFFDLDDPLLHEIRDQILNLDINNLSPLEALNKLNSIKALLLGQ